MRQALFTPRSSFERQNERSFGWFLMRDTREPTPPHPEILSRACLTGSSVTDFEIPPDMTECVPNAAEGNGVIATAYDVVQAVQLTLEAINALARSISLTNTFVCRPKT